MFELPHDPTTGRRCIGSPPAWPCPAPTLQPRMSSSRRRVRASSVFVSASTSSGRKPSSDKRTVLTSGWFAAITNCNRHRTFAGSPSSAPPSDRGKAPLRDRGVSATPDQRSGRKRLATRARTATRWVKLVPPRGCSSDFGFRGPEALADRVEHRSRLLAVPSNDLKYRLRRQQICDGVNRAIERPQFRLDRSSVVATRRQSVLSPRDRAVLRCGTQQQAVDDIAGGN